MNEFKLEHCPFCGSDAFLETMKARKGYEADIHCNGCSANIHTATFDFEEDAVHEAAKLWNKRAYIHDKNVGELISRKAMSDALNRIKVERSETWYSFYQKVLNELCKLPPVEPEKAQLSEEDATKDTTYDCISRQAAIDYFVTNVGFNDEDGYRIDDSDELRKIWTEYFDGIPPAQPEPLTDKEQRIFISAMSREGEVCKQVDNELRNCREPYEVTLVEICHEIVRKVKGALWMI